jgi:hypothetical protein
MAVLVVIKPLRICPRRPLKTRKESLITDLIYQFHEVLQLSISISKIKLGSYTNALVFPRNYL